MPTPPDETGDAHAGDVAMETNSDPPTAETGAGKDEDVIQSEDVNQSPSVAASSVSASESPLAPLNPLDSPSLHPSCTPHDVTLPSESEARLPSEQSASAYSPIPTCSTDLSQGETPTYTPQEQLQDDTIKDTKLDSHTNTLHDDRSVRARSQRSGSVEMFGSFYPAHKIPGRSKPEARGNPQTMYVPGARVKRSGSVEMFGFIYPEKKEGSEESEISDGDGQKYHQMRKFSIPQARTSRSGSVEMFGFMYPEKKEGSEDSDISESDEQKYRQVRKFSIPQARTSRSGSVEMFGFMYPEKKPGEDSEDSDVSETDGQKSRQVRRFSIPQARTTRSGSMEMFGFMYPENKSGEDTTPGERHQVRSPWARVKRSGSVEMFGFSYAKGGGNSDMRDRSDSDTSQKSDDAERKSVPFARVKRSGSVEMFGSFYPSTKNGKSSEVIGNDQEDKDDPKPIPVRPARSGSNPLSLHPIVEADSEHVDLPEVKGSPRSFNVAGARVKRSGSIEMFGTFYPPPRSGEGSNAADGGSPQRISVPKARVKRSGSVEMFGFIYPEKKEKEGSEVSDGQMNRQVRRFSIPQARSTRSGSVEMFGFMYPEKKPGEDSEDSDVSETDAQKSCQVRRFSIPQARTTRSGSMEMFGFMYPENKSGEESTPGECRQVRSPWARVKRSGSVEMFGFSYGKVEENSDTRDRSDSDTSQKSDDVGRKSVPFARVKRSGSVEMFGSFYPSNKNGKSPEVVGNDQEKKNDPKPITVRPARSSSAPLSLHPVVETDAEHEEQLQRHSPPDDKEVKEENKLEDDPSTRPRTKRSGSVDMFGFFDLLGEDGGKQKSRPKPIFVPKARVKRSGSVEMFGFMYPQDKKGEDSKDGESRNPQPINVPGARVKRSGSVEMFGFMYPEKKPDEGSEEGDISESEGQMYRQGRKFSIPQARTTRSGSIEMFGFQYPEKKPGEGSEGSDISESERQMYRQGRKFSIPQARTSRSGSMEMFGFMYPENKTGEGSNEGGVNRQTRSPWFRVKRSGSVEMFGFSYAERLREAAKKANESGLHSEVGSNDQEKKDDLKSTTVRSALSTSAPLSLHPVVEADAEHEEAHPPALQRHALPDDKEVNEEKKLEDDPSTRPRTKRSGSVDMFGFFDLVDEDGGKQKRTPKSIFVPKARVKRSGSVEMFGFMYPQDKKGEDSKDGESKNPQPITVSGARVKRSGSVEMFGFSYPAKKSGESAEETNDGQTNRQERRFSIPQARTTRSGSVEMFGFMYPEKKSEDGDISESEGQMYRQGRRFSIPQARTSRSGSMEMFGFMYPENKTGEGSNEGGVNRQTRSPWFRVKRSGSVEMFGFSYAARLREAAKKAGKSDYDDNQMTDDESKVNPIETIIESPESPKHEPSSGSRNLTGLVTETTDTDLKDTQVLRHTDSQTLDTQHSETEQTKSTDSLAKSRTASKDSESVGSADFVMIQHGDIWKDFTKDSSSPDEVQVEEMKDSEERKDGGGSSSIKEAPGSQQSDGNVNSNHAAEVEPTQPAVKIDVPTVSVTVQIKDADNESTADGQAASNTAAEAEDKVTELPSAVQRRVKPGAGGADESKRRSLMLWVDADLVQTVRTDQGSKSPQNSPDDILSDQKKLKKVIRKERWAVETEHEVRKEMWKQLCLKNSAGASVSHVYTEVEEGLFGKGADSVDPSSITLPSFVDPDHPVASYALKSEGQTRLNRLLCVLADTRPDILYCPLLAPLAGMLLHYMSSEETFDCLSALLGSTRYKFLEVSWVEHESFRMSFERLAAKFAASAHKMFIKQGDVSEIYQDWIWWILEDLPFSHVIRVMDCYLSEGLKIFYRVGLALLMLYKKHKGSIESPDGVAASIREFVRNIPVSPNTLLTVGFQFRGLSRSVIGAYQTKHKETLREDNSPYRAGSRRQNDVITKLNHINSSVITHQQLHTIWGWVPSRFGIYQPSLVFTTQEHGFSLTTFYTRCEYCEPTILLIKTSDKEIFGAYLSSSWSTRNDGDHKGIYFGTGESFLFSLAPEEKKYPWVGILPKEDTKEEEETKEDGEEDGEKGANGGADLKKKMNEMFMRASSSLIAVGGGDGDGILIEGDLTKGFSTHCLTFANPGLAKERSYNCDVIEVITMEDGRNPTNGETA